MKNNMIYLAAGQGRRFGSNKLLWEIEGKPMFAYTLDLLIKITEERPDYTLTVVTMYDEIAEYTKNATKLPAVRCIMSPESRQGISFSIKNGIKDLSDNGCFYTFIVADEPGLTYETLTGFMEGCMASGFLAGVVTHNGVTGNPTMFHGSFKPALMSLTGDVGGKKLLNEYDDGCFMYEVPDGTELSDIDYKR